MAEMQNTGKGRLEIGSLVSTWTKIILPYN